MQMIKSLLALFLTLSQSDTRQLYNNIGNAKLIANGHSYSTGPIESVQLAHYRNLTGEGAWLFSETADVILNTPSNAENTDSIEDEVSEFIITGELLSILRTGKQSYLRSGQPDRYHCGRKCITCRYISGRLPLSK